MTFRLAVVALLIASTGRVASVPVQYDGKIPQLKFAASEIERAFLAKGDSGGARIVLQITKAGLPQSYSIRRARTTFTVTGADAVGAMYGGLDIAEAVRLGKLGELADSDRKPYIAQRG